MLPGATLGTGTVISHLVASGSTSEQPWMFREYTHCAIQVEIPPNFGRQGHAISRDALERGRSTHAAMERSRIRNTATRSSVKADLTHTLARVCQCDILLIGTSFVSSTSTITSYGGIPTVR